MSERTVACAVCGLPVEPGTEHVPPSYAEPCVVQPEGTWERERFGGATSEEAYAGAERLAELARAAGTSAGDWEPDTPEEVAEHSATVAALMPAQLRAIAALDEEETP